MATYLNSLGEDLLLLSVREDNGLLATAHQIDYGLMGAELVALAASGRIDIPDERIRVLNQAPTGDQELDAALQSLLQAGRPVRPRTWVARPRRGIRLAYLNRLVEAGAVRPEPGLLRGMKYVVTDLNRLSATRARLDSVALSDGPVDTVSAAFGGLAHAVRLDHFIYRGWSARPVYRRLAEIGKGQWTVAAATSAVASAQHAADAAAQAARAATDSAVQAAAMAATQAATQAAIAAATQAATQAATDAGGHAGHH